jgi:hypothetical protein
MLEYRWRTFLGGRNKPGWYVLGDLKNEEHTGNIPAYLHYFNFIQDDYEHDMYISMGY